MRPGLTAVVGSCSCSDMIAGREDKQAQLLQGGHARGEAVRKGLEARDAKLKEERELARARLEAQAMGAATNNNESMYSAKNE